MYVFGLRGGSRSTFKELIQADYSSSTQKGPRHPMDSYPGGNGANHHPTFMSSYQRGRQRNKLEVKFWRQVCSVGCRLSLSFMCVCVFTACWWLQRFVNSNGYHSQLIVTETTDERLSFFWSWLAHLVSCWIFKVHVIILLPVLLL